MALLATNRSYRLLFSASAVSNLGDGISALAFPWLAALITRDPVLVSLVATAQRLPWLLFAIPAGVITDRMDRRVLMVRADLMRMGLTCGVIGLILSLPPLPLGTAGPAIAGLCALSFLLGMAEVLRDNAAQTVLPSVVDKADLEAANGQIWSIENIMGAFIGPPLAGVLIAVAVPVPFVFDALSFAVAAWLVWLIALPARPPQPAARLWPQVAEGWRWMRAHPVILRIALVLGAINGLAMMVMTMLVLFSQDVLGLDAVGHGLLLTAGAAGAVLGGMAGPRVVARLGGQACIGLSLVVMTGAYAVVAVASNALVVGLAWGAGMASGMLWNLVTVSYRQRLIPDALLGRVNAIYRFFGWGMMPVGALLGGVIVAQVEPALGREAALRAPIALCAAGHGLVYLYARRRLRL